MRVRSLMLWGLPLALAVAVLTTGYELHVAKQEALEAIHQRMKMIRTAALPGVTHAVWSEDAERVDNHLSSLARLPNVEHVRIEVEKETKAEKGKQVSKEVLNYDMRMIRTYRHRPVQVGKLIIVSGLDKIEAQTWEDAPLILAKNTAAGILLVALLVLMTTRKTEEGATEAAAASQTSQPDLQAAAEPNPIAEFMASDRTTIPPSPPEVIELRSKMVRLERSLSQTNEALEEKTKAVEARTEELQDANDAIRVYARKASTSHKRLREIEAAVQSRIQTPLRALIGYTDLLKSNGVDPEVAQDMRRRLKEARRDLKDGVQGVLRTTQIATSGGALVPVDLEDVVERAVDDLEDEIELSGAAIEVEPLPEIDGDAEQLREMFVELLSNAIANRREDAAPRIEISAEVLAWPKVAQDDLPPADSFLRIRVEDNGRGLDNGAPEKIFDHFGLSPNAKGAGVGLAVCARIAERHGGNIHAESKEDGGAALVVTLPIEQNATI